MQPDEQQMIAALQRQFEDDDARMRNFIGPYRVRYSTTDPGLPPGQAVYQIVENMERVYFLIHLEEDQMTSSFIINNMALWTLAQLIMADPAQLIGLTPPPLP